MPLAAAVMFTWQSLTRCPGLQMQKAMAAKARPITANTHSLTETHSCATPMVHSNHQQAVIHKISILQP